MNTFSNLQDNNIFGDASFMGGAFDEKNLDTTIGLKSDMGVGNINSLFNSIKSPEINEDANRRSKRQTDSGSSDSKNNTNANNNTGNSTVWIIVLIVIIIILIIGFIIYKVAKTKQVQEKAKQIYTNMSDKLSSLRDSVKRTTIDSQ